MKDNFSSMLVIILVLAVVFYLTWVVTKFVATRSKGKTTGRFMRVVDRLNISNDKAILLVKVGEEFCVIGVTGHEMRLIKTLDAAEAEAFTAEAAKPGEAWPGGAAASSVWKGMQSFSSRLGIAMKKPANLKPQNGTTPTDWGTTQGYDQNEGHGRGDTAQPTDPAKPQNKQYDDQSVIDMMNERIKLRKDSKWR